MPTGGDQTPRVLIVRHGETPFNARHLVRGWTNVPLNAKGRKEARRVADRLKNEPIKRIYTSDLDRARETAQTIAKANLEHPTLVATRKLRPWHLGDWEGKPIKTTLKRRLELIEHKRDIAPNGGESFNDFAHRFIPFLTKTLDEAKAEKATICLVCHTHNQRVAVSWIVPPFGVLSMKPLIGEEELPPGGVVTVELRKGKWVIGKEDRKVAGEDATTDRRLDDDDPSDPPDDASPDELLTWWLSIQPLLLGTLYTHAYDAGVQAFNDQFPEQAIDLDTLSADDAFQAAILQSHATSIGKMYGEIQAALDEANGDPAALDAWFNSNAYRIGMMGDSLAWAAEQHGYASAGTDSGLQIDWQLGEVKTEHCDDCLANAAGGPYAADELPGVPGDGSTECGASCNCSLEYIDSTAEAA